MATLHRFRDTTCMTYVTVCDLEQCLYTTVKITVQCRISYSSAIAS